MVWSAASLQVAAEFFHLFNGGKNCSQVLAIVIRCDDGGQQWEGIGIGGVGLASDAGKGCIW